jgi:hypothetical protein
MKKVCRNFFLVFPLVIDILLDNMERAEKAAAAVAAAAAAASSHKVCNCIYLKYN